MRHNQITITHPQDAPDISTRLTILKNQHNINKSAFCCEWINRGIDEFYSSIKQSAPS